MLLRSKRVLDLVEQDAECAWFSNEREAEDEGSVTQLTLPTEDWNQFGNPEQVTVTVEAGDKLNDEETAEDDKVAIDNVEVVGRG